MVVAVANGNVVMTITLFTSSVSTLQYIEKEAPDFIRDNYFPGACCDQYSVVADRETLMLCTQQSC